MMLLRVTNQLPIEYLHSTNTYSVGMPLVQKVFVVECYRKVIITLRRYFVNFVAKLNQIKHKQHEWP